MSRENPTQKELTDAAATLGISVSEVPDIMKIMHTFNMSLGADVVHTLESLDKANVNIFQSVTLVLEQLRIHREGLQNHTSAMAVSSIIESIMKGGEG